VSSMSLVTVRMDSNSNGKVDTAPLGEQYVFGHR
jgi:hypothetical protein